MNVLASQETRDAISAIYKGVIDQWNRETYVKCFTDREKNNMSDTPRTDRTDLYDYQTAIDFARTLERENNAMRAELDRLLDVVCEEDHSVIVSVLSHATT